jgi:hypothetical protein
MFLTNYIFGTLSSSTVVFTLKLSKNIIFESKVQNSIKISPNLIRVFSLFQTSPQMEKRTR